MIDRMAVSPSAAEYIDLAALDALRAALPGRVFTPGDEGYDEARAGFSVVDQPTPHVVVNAHSRDDVVAAVHFARTQELPVGVKATGHNFGFPYHGGVMINTERMQGIQIDGLAQTARVEAGVRWGAVIAAAQPYGLAPLSGSSPTVGVIGYSLFGGFGWLLRKYGAAVDSVIAAELVTADGELRRVSQASEPELFWALRGASGNFGVVTALEFRLYPVTEIYGGALFFPMEQAREIFTAYSQWLETIPEEVTSSIVMMRMPPLPEVPEMLRGKAVVSIRAAILGTEAEGAALLKPLHDLPGLIVSTFALIPYAAARTIANDPEKPSPVVRTTMMLNDLSPDTIDTLIGVNGMNGSNPVLVLEIRHLGGAMRRIHPDSCAFSQRNAPFLMQTVDMIFDPARGEAVRANTRAMFDAMHVHSTGGVLPSWLGDGDYGVDRMRAGFTAEHYQRLVALKTYYDPSNMFRLNHNIPPSKKGRTPSFIHAMRAS